ncbi:hypothetical protein BDZ94DRAFT_1251551 [Collybia nuda]|uniref:DUF7330 domain-containing protein n=1 Tax=Collybia nuda TaxID=64659 RepID=A0A9P6CN18_9AGAR|nr:hypothetical protein BDZ94DRAFT_1251551 [Collybia nuda]
MSTDHSMLSTSTCEKLSPLLHASTSGTHKVKYTPHEDWDFHLDIAHKPIDLSLALPHYRARYQPVDHRMSMFVGSESAPIRVKVCRYYPQSKFYLEVQGGSSDVTVWLPSDFRGQIHHSSKASFSAGFVNRIMQNVRLNDPEYNEIYSEDDVIVCTQGHITFRMWDIQTCAPEKPHKEAFRRMFGCTRRAPETAIDWDFLLDD